VINGRRIKNVLWFLALTCALVVHIEHLLAAHNQTDREIAWADSVLAGLTLDQKVGQLFMVAAYSNKNEAYYADLELLITKYAVGGLLFFQGGPKRQVKLINRYQAKAKVPLLIGMDLEWGLGMRLDSTVSFPKQMTLGAIKDNNLIYKMGQEIARQCKAVGVHINFAPVVDINSNSRNPVIGVRSFGEDKRNVAAKGLAYMRGLQDGGVMACAKHFPGHGNTSSDSHVKLPTLRSSKQGLMETEIYPFQNLIQNDLKATMVGHLNVPSLDDSGLPASLSPSVVTDLLVQELGFKGLAISDALNMRGIAEYQNDGEAELMAFKAGNDILLFPINLPVAMARLKRALAAGVISSAEIDRRVHKVLRAKHWSGLHTWQPLPLERLDSRINNPSAISLITDLLAASVTVVKNDLGLVPIRVLDNSSIASLSLGVDGISDFQEYLKHYTAVDSYALLDPAKTQTLQSDLLRYKNRYCGFAWAEQLS